MILLDHLFCDKIFVKITLGIQIVWKFLSDVQMISILLKYIIWYEVVIDLDAQSDFEK